MNRRVDIFFRTINNLTKLYRTDKNMQNYHWAFLVFKNHLIDEIGEIHKGWDIFAQKNKLLGWINAIVLFSNKEEKAYPYVYSLIMIDNHEYINQKEWSKNLKKIFNLNDTPIIEIKKIKQKKAYVKLEADKKIPFYIIPPLVSLLQSDPLISMDSGGKLKNILELKGKELNKEEEPIAEFWWKIGVKNKDNIYL